MSGHSESRHFHRTKRSHSNSSTRNRTDSPHHRHRSPDREAGPSTSSHRYSDTTRTVRSPPPRDYGYGSHHDRYDNDNTRMYDSPYADPSSYYIAQPDVGLQNYISRHYNDTRYPHDAPPSSYYTEPDSNKRKHRSNSPPSMAHTRTHNAPISSATGPPRASREPRPSIPQAPTEDYLAISLEQPSTSTSSSSRKLLVLDLNGSLLLRSPRPPRAAYPRYPNRPPGQRYVAATPHSTGHPQQHDPHALPKLRKVYPRPYMPAFVAFLSHPSTLSWLDTMVWSSAMPHSVDDMVQNCFGEQRDAALRAIWARDTLGLDEGAYHNKSDTIKNLAKVWKEVDLSPAFAPSTDLPEAPQNLRKRHSAQTTLLLDDSPRKARLQPWNHLCIPEYTAKERQHDEQLYHSRLIAQAASPPSVDPSDVIDADLNPSEARMARRKAKKAAKKAAKVAAAQGIPPPSTDPATESEEETEEMEDSYDETLLAVIGILDDIKHQENVAAWMRSGGLFRDGEVPDAKPIVETDSDEVETELREGPELVKVSHRHLDSSSAPVEEGTVAEVVERQMWFEHPHTLKSWAMKGREVLDKLGIEINDGISSWY